MRVGTSNHHKKIVFADIISEILSKNDSGECFSRCFGFLYGVPGFNITESTMLQYCQSQRLLRRLCKFLNLFQNSLYFDEDRRC